MKKTIVILHGWRLSGARYNDIAAIFTAKGYTVFSPDMPGFGKEKLAKPVMTIADYVLFMKAYFQRHNLHTVILIGHSFGARVAVKFTATYPEYVSRLILTGAPLIKQPLSMKKKLIATVATLGKRVLGTMGEQHQIFKKMLYKTIGEWDYYKAGELQATFTAVIAEDLSAVLPSVQVPTLVLWGEHDSFVSSRIGEEIAKKIPNATYVVIPGGTHKLPYENPVLFAEKVLAFSK